MSKGEYRLHSHREKRGVNVGAAIVFIALIGFLVLGVKAMYGSPNEHSFDELISQAAMRYGVDENLVRAIIKQESNYDPNAENPFDPSYGLMQITAGAATDYGLTDLSPEKLKDPQTNLLCGTWYLAHFLDRYDLDASIQMYNEGEGNYLQGKRVPDYLAKVKGYLDDYNSSSTESDDTEGN